MKWIKVPVDCRLAVVIKKRKCRDGRIYRTSECLLCHVLAQHVLISTFTPYQSVGPADPPSHIQICSILKHHFNEALVDDTFETSEQPVRSSGRAYWPLNTPGNVYVQCAHTHTQASYMYCKS